MHRVRRLTYSCFWHLHPFVGEVGLIVAGRQRSVLGGLSRLVHTLMRHCRDSGIVTGLHVVTIVHGVSMRHSKKKNTLTLMEQSRLSVHSRVARDATEEFVILMEQSGKAVRKREKNVR